MNACTSAHLECIHSCMHACMRACTHACMHMHACVHLRTHALKLACMHALYEFMHECMYDYVHACTRAWTNAVTALRNFMSTDESKAAILRAGHLRELLPLLMKDDATRAFWAKRRPDRLAPDRRKPVNTHVYIHAHTHISCSPTFLYTCLTHRIVANG